VLTGSGGWAADSWSASFLGIWKLRPLGERSRRPNTRTSVERPVPLFRATVLLFLVPDVLPDRYFVSTYGRDEVATCPEVLPDEVPPPFSGNRYYGT